MSLEKPLNKEKANVDLYYNILANNIGKFENGQNILFVDLGNNDVYYKFIVNNKNCNYIIIDQLLKEDLLKAWFPNTNITFIGAEDNSIIKALENLNMKFDKIIMNPPYSKNLHLKILAEAIKHLSEDGECVNLSPIRWLQDPLAKYKKNSDLKRFEDSVAKHIESLDTVEIDDAQKIFQAGMMTMLGIYKCKCNLNNDSFDYERFKFHFINETLFTKIILSKKFNFPKLCKYDEMMNDVFVPIKSIANPDRTTAYNICTTTFKWIKDKKLPNGEKWTNGIYKSKSMLDNKIPFGLCFPSEKIAKNFYESTYMTFYKFANYLVKTDNQNITTQFLPWMGDCINPRTGLTGYESEWTNEDFYTYFNITKEEQELIEKTMEKYK